MKKAMVSAAWFLAAFVVTYVVLCYIPPLQIKLDADPLTYFIESIKKAAIFKGIVSLTIGAAAGALSAASDRNAK